LLSSQSATCCASKRMDVRTRKNGMCPSATSLYNVRTATPSRSASSSTVRAFVLVRNCSTRVIMDVKYLPRPAANPSYCGDGPPGPNAASRFGSFASPFSFLTSEPGLQPSQPGVSDTGTGSIRSGAALGQEQPGPAQAPLRCAARFGLPRAKRVVSSPPPSWRRLRKSDTSSGNSPLWQIANVT